jgi:hypothetical protein
MRYPPRLSLKPLTPSHSHLIRGLAMFAPRVFAASFALLCMATTSLAEPLPGTQPLEIEGDLADQMVSGIDRFLLRETAETVAKRAHHWKRDVSSVENHRRS